MRKGGRGGTFVRFRTSLFVFSSVCHGEASVGRQNCVGATRKIQKLDEICYGMVQAALTLNMNIERAVLAKLFI